MYKQDMKNIWLIPLIIFIVSTILNFAILYLKCPLIVESDQATLSECDWNPIDPDFGKESCVACGTIYFKKVYI